MSKKLEQDSLKDVTGGYGNYVNNKPKEAGFWYVCTYSLKFKTVDAKGGYATASARDFALQVTVEGAQAAGATNITSETGFNEGD